MNKMLMFRCDKMCIFVNNYHSSCRSFYYIYGLLSAMLKLQLPVQSVYITTKVVSSNPVHCEVYLIQHYVIKLVSDLRQVCGFL